MQAANVKGERNGPGELGNGKKTESAGEPARPFRWRQLWPLAVLIAGFALFFLSGASDYTTFETLRNHRDVLIGWVQDQLFLTAAVFLLIYAVATALSLPIATLLTIVGGFLFGPLLGTALVVVGATAGATVVFLAARSSLGDVLRQRAGPRLRRVEAGFRRNAFNYLLLLRLIPLFPFFLVNLAPAFLGISLRTYVLATFLGIIPGSFVYVEVGAGLDSVLATEGAPDLGNILTADVIVALFGLAALSIAPIVYRRFAGRRQAVHDNPTRNGQ